jgi:hypothetical protein
MPRLCGRYSRPILGRCRLVALSDQFAYNVPIGSAFFRAKSVQITSYPQFILPAVGKPLDFGLFAPEWCPRRHTDAGHMAIGRRAVGTGHSAARVTAIIALSGSRHGCYRTRMGHVPSARSCPVAPPLDGRPDQSGLLPLAGQSTCHTPSYGSQYVHLILPFLAAVVGIGTGGRPARIARSAEVIGADHVLICRERCCLFCERN